MAAFKSLVERVRRSQAEGASAITSQLWYDAPESDNTTTSLMKIDPDRAAAGTETKINNTTLKCLASLFLPLALFSQPKKNQVTTADKRHEGTVRAELHLNGEDRNILFYPLTCMPAGPESRLLQ